MTRAVYPFALCLTLGLLATMWLRPGLAQDWIEMANRVRLQSPDNGSAGSNLSPTSVPTADPTQQTQFGGYGQPPIQPMPAARPTNWPATASPGSTTPGSMPPASPAGPTNAPPAANAGVMVWDPNTAAQPNSNTQPGVARYGQPQPPPAAAGQPGFAPQPAAVPFAPQTGTFDPNVQPLPEVGAPVGQSPVGQSPVGQSPVGQSPVGQSPPGLNAQNLQVWPTPPKDLPEAQVAAKIGDQTVLVGDLKAMVADQLHRSGVEIPPDQQEQFFAQANRQLLKQLIETKMIYNDALKTIPKEALPKIESDLNGDFDKNALPKLMESHQAISVTDLDQKIRQRGSSLEFMRRCNFEKNFATGWLQQKVNFKPEIPISDVAGYYQSNLKEYEFAAKARWEELMVRFDRYPDRASAEAAIVQMGNAVQQGRPFADVARASSHGSTATDGGAWDWTTKGSLATTILDEAIFGLPVGTLSQILESERGLHIVRVVERTEAGRQSFMEVQPEIKKQLRQERIQKQVQEYLDQIRKETPVWTMYDKEPGGLEGVQQERRSVFE